MKISEYRLFEYQREDGGYPFTEWLRSLKDQRTIARIQARIERVAAGNFGDFKPLKNAKGIHELRLDFGPGYRVYFGIKGNDIVILLCGGDKRSQKKDIKRALDYWSNYLQRKNAS